ncbi:MAG: hypothetical protein GC162_21060 [Planctomycetes bacterium]|nr:hypothetical protein [Planctomycetota bacterium]
MRKGQFIGVLALLVAIFGGEARALNIVFDYSFDTNGFFDEAAHPGRRATLEAAAQWYVPFLDDLQRIEPSSSASPSDVDPSVGPFDVWEARFANPATGATQGVAGLVVPEKTVIVYAGGRNLPDSVLGRGGFGTAFRFLVEPWNTLVTTRGQGDTQGADAVDFGPWGGSIAFDSFDEETNAERVWHTGLSDPLVDEYDLLSVAIHELGHLFGFGSADSFKALATTDHKFTGDAATAANGGTQPSLFTDNGHWAEGTMSEVNGITQETAMDPSLNIVNGVSDRKYLTDLDYAAFRDLGWHISLPGDANTDGAVDISDLVLLAQSFGLSGNVGWLNGDFNHDGAVDISDLVLLAKSFGLSGEVQFSTPADLLALLTTLPTPEPGMGMIGLMVFNAALMRRRRITCRGSSRSADA